MDDVISRQAAIDAFLTELTKRERKNLLHTWSTVEVKHFVVEMLEQLPSAQPEPQSQVYGFTLDYLVPFAYACRKAGIEDRDLKNFVMNTEWIYEVVRKDYEAQMKEAIAKIFKEDR